MKTAFLFAGQGSQHIGMGKDFYEQYEAFRKIFNLLPERLRNMAFRGSEEELSDTVNTQPIMLAFAIGVYRLFEEEGIKADMAAGLSLGEYSALCASGVFETEQAIDIISYRAEAMAKAAEGVGCSMKAVIGLKGEDVEACCKEAREFGMVEVANFNCPGQVVIAGEIKAVDAATELLINRGARRCLPLKVSGPFHTSFMKEAGEKLRKLFEDTSFGDMNFPVLFNFTGDELRKGETVADMLVNQVSGSVRFEDEIRKILASGAEAIVEIGPGNVLAGFVKKVDRKVKLMSIDGVEDFIKAVESLKA